MGKSKETIDWYKANGICVRCGQEKVKKGRSMCGKCSATRSESARIWYHNLDEESKKRLSEKHKDSRRKTEQNRIAQRLCFRCGKRPPIGDTPYSQCAVCKAKSKEYTRQRRKKHGNIPLDERTPGELCYRCAKPITSGKYCDECREIVVNKMLYARQFKRKESGWSSYPFVFGKGNTNGTD